MKPLAYYAPTSLNEALELLAQNPEKTTIIAGGTDVIIEMNEKWIDPSVMISLDKLDCLRYVKQEDGFVKIGALTRFADLEENEYVKENLKALYETVIHVGSPQIRNLGTIGGNVVNASVAGDSPTVFICYGASVVLESVRGQRIMTLEDFNKGPARCQIANDEILTEVRFPIPKANEAYSYFKIGKRKSLAIVVLAVSIYVARDENGKVSDSRVVLGAVSKHPMRSEELEAKLLGQELTAEFIASILPEFTAVIDAAIPNRPSVVYKRESVRGAARHCFEQIQDEFKLI